MSSPAKSKAQIYRRRAIFIILIPVILYVLYVLSYGPAWSLGVRRNARPMMIESKFRYVPYFIREHYIRFWVKYVDPSLARVVVLMK